MRARPKKRPDRLTAPADGRRLEDIIGELQSEKGVPENPQEYRLVIKVSEDREARSERPPTVDAPVPPATASEGKPKREKAPAAPRIGADAPGTVDEDSKSTRKRRRRRRRKGRGGGS